MAVNFGDTLMEGSIEPTVKVQAPVQDDSGAMLANALAPAAEFLGQVAGGVFKSNIENENAKILTAYENELLDLADAVDQNSISRNEAMIKARNIRRQYLSNAPALQDDFDTVWTDFAGANGLGHVVIQGTVEQQANEALAKEAFSKGYSVDEYRMFQSRANELAALNTEVDILKGRGAQLTETQRLKYTQATVGLAESAYPSAQRQINEAMAAINANPNNKTEIATNLNTVIGQSVAQLKYLTGNSEDNAYITAPIEGAMDTFNKWVNGEVSNAVLEGALKQTQSTYSLMYANDPTLGPVIAQSKLINDLGLANTTFGVDIWTPEALKKLAEVSNPNKTVNLTDNTEGSARFSDNIRQAAGAITNTSSPELITELNDAINDAVNSAYVHERSAEGAIGFKDIVELLGSNEVGAFLSTHGKIDARYKDQFISVLQNNYEQELLPAVDRAWTAPVPIQNPTAGERVEMQNIPMNQLLEPRWNGNAVEFVPKAAYVNNARVIALANDVTSGDNSIGIPLNNLINAYANVTGTDASKIYEEDFANRLFGISADGGEAAAPLTGGVGEGADEATDTEADAQSFSIGDFNPDTLEPLEEYTTQASSLTTELPPLDPAYTDVAGINYDDYLPSIRASESAGDDSAKNPTSTATGRYQFLKSTWNDLVNRYPNTGLTYDGRLNPQQQEVAIRLFTAENARQLRTNGVPLNNGTLYAAHFLGAGDAVKVLNATNGLVSDYVPARVISANSFLRGMTVAQFKAWANRKGNA
jgi:hypothetical protein